MTSYYKLIDWWLLWALNMLVLTACVHTYICHVNLGSDSVLFSFGSSVRTVSLVGEHRIIADHDGVVKRIAPAKTDPR